MLYTLGVKDLRITLKDKMHNMLSTSMAYVLTPLLHNSLTP